MNHGPVTSQQSPILDKMLQLALMAGCFTGALMVGMESFSYMGIVVACSVVLLFGFIALGVELGEPWGGLFKRASASVGVAFIVWMTVVVILNLSLPPQTIEPETRQNAVEAYLADEAATQTQPAATLTEGPHQATGSQKEPSPAYKTILPAVLILGVFNLFGTLPLFWYAITGIIPPWLAPKPGTQSSEKTQRTRPQHQPQTHRDGQAQAQSTAQNQAHSQGSTPQHPSPNSTPKTQELVQQNPNKGPIQSPKRSKQTQTPQHNPPTQQSARSKDMNYQPTSPTTYRPSTRQFAPGQQQGQSSPPPQIPEQDFLSPPPKAPASTPAPKDTNAPSPDLEGM